MAKQTFTTGDVLTAAAMTSLQQTAMGGGATTAKTASYTLVAADAGTVVQMNSASATTITVNTALFAAGDSVQIQNIGAGVCTVTAGTATVSTAGSLALSQYEGGQLYFNTTSAALFFDVVQSSSSSLTSQSANLAADVTMTSANTYYDGVSTSLAAGTWLIIASIYVDDPSNTGGTVTAKLWDGTNVSSSGEMFVGGTTTQVTITLSGIVSPASTTTYKISAATSQNIHVIRAACVQNGAGNNASHISAVKIA